MRVGTWEITETTREKKEIASEYNWRLGRNVITPAVIPINVLMSIPIRTQLSLLCIT